MVHTVQGLFPCWNIAITSFNPVLKIASHYPIKEVFLTYRLVNARIIIACTVNNEFSIKILWIVTVLFVQPIGNVVLRDISLN